MKGTASLWMEGRIFRVEKRTRSSTALKQCLAEDLILFSNLRKILPIQGNLRYTGHLLRPNFGEKYFDMTQSYIDQGYTELVNNGERSHEFGYSNSWCFSHHPVVNARKHKNERMHKNQRSRG